MNWEDPARMTKNSLIEAIRRAAGHEYICKISNDIWGTIYWEDLDAPSLLGLLRKIKGNAPAMPGKPF